VSDKLRCINAFEYEGRIYPGGAEVEEDAAILETHRAHFAVVTPVERTFSAVVSETADAAPGQPRSITTPVKRGPGRPPKVKQQDVIPPADTKATDTKNED
jgi:hypothetical protein